MYVNWGEGQADVLMIGLSPYDNNAQINAYKAQMGISNPCAGIDGNSTQAIATVIEGQQFFGYPTYSVVCPDKKLNFGVCFPPSPECFDPYIVNCGATSTKDIAENPYMFNLYPNPSSGIVNLELFVAGAARLEIVNLMGSVVFQQQLNSSGHSFQILDLGDLHDGFYIVSVQTVSQIFTSKFTIKR